MNLLTKDIPLLSVVEVKEILNKHNGDSFFDIGIRSTIAVNKNTPMEILQILINDDEDFISSQANEILTQRKTKPKNADRRIRNRC